METDKTSSTSKPRRSERTLSGGQEEEVYSTPTGTKRKRNTTDNNMSSKNKKTNSECTNAQLMSTLDRLAEKMDSLPNKADLQSVETELTNKLYQSTIKFDKKIQDNCREIRMLGQRIDKQAQAMAKLEEEVETHKKKTTKTSTVAEEKRREAQDEKYFKARRSLKIWPITVKANEEPTVCVRRFFIMNMKVPADLAREAEIESVKKSTQNHQKSRITQEYIVTFADVETRDSIKSYANGLAGNQGQAGLRLELPDTLRGSYKVLDEHGLALKNLYGKDTKRSIKFDDRNKNLMMDVKLPGSLKWHNVTIEQARRAKKMSEEMEIAKLSKGKTIAGPSADRERAKVLMLVYSPEKEATVATGTNLIDIEESFHENTRGADRTAAADETEFEDAAEVSEEDSDESMNRLLHGRNARNPYQ